MSRAHNVISGDSLNAVSIRYLGTASKWRQIVNANPQLSSRKTAADGLPPIFPGDILKIPQEVNERPVTLQAVKTVEAATGEQDVSIIIDGKRITGFTSYEINLSYSSFDTFSFLAPFNTAIKEIKQAIKPFTFKNCMVYYLDDLLFKGTLLTSDSELQPSTTEMVLQGYPLCGVLNDCTVPPSKYPANYSGLNIKQIAEELTEPYGVNVVFESEPGEPFSEVAYEPSERILSFLLKLARQRQFLFNNDKDGSLVFFKAAKKTAFMSFKEGNAPLLSITPQFNAQGFYSHITGHSKTDNNTPEPLSYTYENKYLTKKGIIRHETIMADDAETSTDLENAVIAHAGRMFADCVSYNLKCAGHLNSEGKLFKKGMTVNVEAPGAMITRQANFTAKNIKLLRNENGKTAELELVLPGSFLDELPEVLPWED